MNNDRYLPVSEFLPQEQQEQDRKLYSLLTTPDYGLLSDPYDIQEEEVIELPGMPTTLVPERNTCQNSILKVVSTAQSFTKASQSSYFAKSRKTG